MLSLANRYILSVANWTNHQMNSNISLKDALTIVKISVINVSFQESSVLNFKINISG